MADRWDEYGQDSRPPSPQERAYWAEMTPGLDEAGRFLDAVLPCKVCGGTGVVAGPDGFGNYDPCDECSDQPQHEPVTVDEDGDA